VPHSSFATWEPKAEMDDDEPILDSALGGPTERPPPPPLPGTTESDAPGASGSDVGVAQVFVNVGRRDGARTADLQRLLEAAGLAAEETSRIRVRERNSFITVKKELVERTVAALSGQVIGGRQVFAEPARVRETG
jgi:ATP-dependent RNA helicase DeaD